MFPTEIFRTAAFRFVLASSAAFSALTLLLFGFIYWQTTIYETNRIDTILIGESNTLVTESRPDLIRAVGSRLSTDLHRITFAALFSPQGALIAGNLQQPPVGLVADGRVHGVSANRLNPASSETEPALAIARTLANGDLLVIGRNIDELVELRGLVHRALTLGLVPALLLSLLAGIILSTRSLNHIKIIHQTLKRIIRGHLQERLPTRGTRDDLDQLVYAVNGMLDEIAKLMVDLRGIGDNIAHDLRMPLARLRARLERGRSQQVPAAELEDIVDRAIADLDQISAIITAILRIGEIENGGRHAGFTWLDLDEVMCELAELYQPIAEAAGIEFHFQTNHAGTILADRDLLMEALVNLVDNALKFTPAGGSVTVAALRRAEVPVIRVEDTGPGIPLDQREHVTKRFYRSDKSRSIQGSGLGLSLVQAIVRLHGFSLAIVADPPGCVIEITCGAVRDDAYGHHN